MGTYRQPAQLIDKSFETINQSFAALGKQMQAQLAAKQKAKQLAAEKAQAKKDREYAAFDKKRDKAVMDYQVKIDNWQHINQARGEDWEETDLTIESQLKDNANHYLDIMGEAEDDSTEYRAAERALRNMIEQYPIMAGLLNQESEELAGAYSPTGDNQLAPDKAGAVLLSNDPKAGIKTKMLHDIKFSKNPARFTITTSPTGVMMTYKDPDSGEEFQLNAAEYKMYKEGGNDLVGVTNEEDFNKFMDGVWDIAGNDYKPFKEKLTQYRKDKESGKDVKITEVYQTYDRANQTLKNNIEKYVKGNGTITQSQWQLLGGKGVYDPSNEEMQAQAVDLLYKKQMDKYGKDPSSNFTAQELKQKKIEVDEKVETLKTGGFDIKSVPGLDPGTHSYAEVRDGFNNSDDKATYAVRLLNDAYNQDGKNGDFVTGKDLLAQAEKSTDMNDKEQVEALENLKKEINANGVYFPDGDEYVEQDIQQWTDVRGRLGNLSTFPDKAMRQLDGESTSDSSVSNPTGVIKIKNLRQQNATPAEEDREKPEANEMEQDGTNVEVDTPQSDDEFDEVFGAEEEIEQPVYKNEKGEDISFEEDSEDFLRNIEVTYGGLDEAKGTTAGIASYGNKNDTRIKDHLNSTKKLGTYFDGTDKKGLKADIGEDVYNALSDAEKAILRMEHLNVGWNPKVLMLQTAGIISKDDRGKYHNPGKQKDPSKWDVNKLYEENKDKIAELLKGKDNVMLENLAAIYKGTDNSKKGYTPEQNKLRNKGFQEQYTRRIADIKKHYKI